MRAIKFRGKSLKYGNWLYGSLWLGGDNAYIIHERPVEKAGEMMWHDTYVTEVTPDTIGQHTGLKDANGKEIYEGDILRDSSGFTAVVVAYKGAFRLLDNKSQIGDIGPAYNLLRENDFSIIGNVCDNKDLLK